MAPLVTAAPTTWRPPTRPTSKHLALRDAFPTWRFITTATAGEATVTSPRAPPPPPWSSRQRKNFSPDRPGASLIQKPLAWSPPSTAATPRRALTSREEPRRPMPLDVMVLSEPAVVERSQNACQSGSSHVPTATNAPSVLGTPPSHEVQGKDGLEQYQPARVVPGRPKTELPAEHDARAQLTLIERAKQAMFTCDQAAQYVTTPDNELIRTRLLAAAFPLSQRLPEAGYCTRIHPPVTVPLPDVAKPPRVYAAAKARVATVRSTPCHSLVSPAASLLPSSIMGHRRGPGDGPPSRRWLLHAQKLLIDRRHDRLSRQAAGEGPSERGGRGGTQFNAQLMRITALSDVNDDNHSQRDDEHGTTPHRGESAPPPVRRPPSDADEVETVSLVSLENMSSIPSAVQRTPNAAIVLDAIRRGEPPKMPVNSTGVSFVAESRSTANMFSRPQPPKTYDPRAIPLYGNVTTDSMRRGSTTAGSDAATVDRREIPSVAAVDDAVTLAPDLLAKYVQRPEAVGLPQTFTPAQVQFIRGMDNMRKEFAFTEEEGAQLGQLVLEMQERQLHGRFADLHRDDEAFLGETNVATQRLTSAMSDAAEAILAKAGSEGLQPPRPPPVQLRAAREYVPVQRTAPGQGGGLLFMMGSDRGDAMRPFVEDIDRVRHQRQQVALVHKIALETKLFGLSSPDALRARDEASPESTSQQRSHNRSPLQEETSRKPAASRAGRENAPRRVTGSYRSATHATGSTVGMPDVPEEEHAFRQSLRATLVDADVSEAMRHLAAVLPAADD